MTDVLCERQCPFKRNYSVQLRRVHCARSRIHIDEDGRCDMSKNDIVKVKEICHPNSVKLVKRNGGASKRKQK